MKFIARLAQRWQRYEGPSAWGTLSRFVRGAPNVRFGRGFRSDGVFRCLIDPRAHLSIGENVEFRRGVDVRVHGTARVVIEDGVRIN